MLKIIVKILTCININKLECKASGATGTITVTGININKLECK